MLKVMKYDWKNGWYNVRTTLIAAVVLSIVAGIAFGLIGGSPVVSENQVAIIGDNQDAIFMVISIIWFAVMVALLVLTVDAIGRNMISRMFGPEAYLTHALPVDTWELLLGKSVGTWLFGVFMVFMAGALVILLFAFTIAGSGEMFALIAKFVEILPKLGDYHLEQIADGFTFLLYGILGFLAGSYLLVVQFQFICIAARQFGRFHLAGGCVVLWVLICIENNLNRGLSLGFLAVLLTSAACFAGSNWLLKHRLNV